MQLNGEELHNLDSDMPQEVSDAAGILGFQTAFHCRCEGCLDLAKFTTRMLLKEASMSDEDALAQTLQVMQQINGWKSCSQAFRDRYFHYRDKAFAASEHQITSQLVLEEQVLKDKLLKEELLKEKLLMEALLKVTYTKVICMKLDHDDSLTTSCTAISSRQEPKPSG